MVAISLYKGNLHRLPPDVPRRWAVPTPTISIKQFKALIQRRSRALSRLQSSNPNNPNPNPHPNNNNNHSSIPTTLNNNNDDTNCNETQLEDLNEKEDVRVVEQGVESVKKLVVEDKADDQLAEEKKEEDVDNVENMEAEPKPEAEKSNTENATSDKEQRIKEVKEKLEVLNEKKHSLVQVLKQILNVEEQLKRQHSTQGMSARPPPLPLQVDTTTDSGSMTRVNTPRIGSDGNPCGDTDVGEPDDGSNHNHSRQLPLMSSTSPSSDSQQRKPASTMVPHSYRTTIGVAGSPSRFAPAGQVHSSVSVSGTSYIASSPSPAASGGTSVFRDARLPSPWN